MRRDDFRALALAIGVGISVLLGGFSCSWRPNSGNTPAVVHSGDTLTVELKRGQRTEQLRLLVSQEGAISLPLVGDRTVAGKTTEQVKLLVQREYRLLESYAPLEVSVELIPKKR